jgi:hypothetical protein
MEIEGEEEKLLVMNRRERREAVGHEWNGRERREAVGLEWNGR